MKFDRTRVPEVWNALFRYVFLFTFPFPLLALNPRPNSSLRLWESRKAWPLTFSEIYEGLDGVSSGLKAIEDRKTWGKAIVRIKEDDGGAKL